VRVTIHQSDGKGVVLKIEVRIAGLNVPELYRAWQNSAPSLLQQSLLVDLRGVTHVDETGHNLLANIHAQAGAEFLAETPLTKYFAEEAEQGVRTGSEY